MRISDWSSDVCSSDLREKLAADDFTAHEIDRIVEAVPIATHNQRGLGTLHIGCPSSEDIEAETLVRMVEESMSSEDRKSVVSGKRVSVRVDLGGRRIIKKKNKYSK